jgi:tRNA-dihydrouridine synthase B
VAAAIADRILPRTSTPGARGVGVPAFIDRLYGEFIGVRSARKHIGWALRELPGGEAFRARMNTIDDCDAQIAAVARFFAELGERHALWPAGAAAAANDASLRQAA